MPNVHKDFHGALSAGIQFVLDRHGPEALAEFLDQVAANVYRPLIERIRQEGLKALEEHWRRIFELEGGDYSLEYESETLVLRVERCPAIHHMKEHGYAIADRFCESTRVVNEGICRRAGCACSVEYDQEAGTCVQKFWRAGP